MKVMALDYGDARTGVAVSDPAGMLVGFTTVITEWNREKTAEKVAALVREKKPERLIMGFPKNMDGTEGPRADLYREFGGTAHGENRHGGGAVGRTAHHH